MTTSKKPTILITGATGNIGSALCNQLAAQGIPFKAMVRSAESAKKLSLPNNAEFIIGDFNEPKSIEEALNGIEQAFLLTNSSEDAERLQTTFVNMAERAGVKHIVKLSQWAADINSPVRFLRYHAAVEQKIKQSGMAYTFLRPNLFMQGLLDFKYVIAKQGKFFASAGDALISAIDIRDIASVAAAVLTDGEQYYHKIYNLTGPKALTHEQMATSLSQAMQQPVAFINVSPDDMLKAVLAAGFPTWQAEGLIEDYEHYARGEASEISPDVKNIIGRPPISFETFANDYAQQFK